MSPYRMLVMTALVAACGGRAPEPAAVAKARGKDVVLELDGLQFTAAEIEQYLPYLESIDRRLGRRAKIRFILNEHLIPLKLARRAFAKKRRLMERRARALSSFIGNQGVLELAARGGTLHGFRPKKPFSRHALPLPVARYVFEDRHLGQVSPAIETPQGFCVIAAYEIHRGQTRVSDGADAYEVPFYTHTPAEFDAWYRRAQRQVMSKLTYVHPDYAEALPSWLKQR